MKGNPQTAVATRAFHAKLHFSRLQKNDVVKIKNAKSHQYNKIYTFAVIQEFNLDFGLSLYELWRQFREIKFPWSTFSLQIAKIKLA